MGALALDIAFNAHELVRNQQQRILTIVAIDEEGHVYVEEEHTPYELYELERIDQTNVVKFKPRY